MIQVSMRVTYTGSDYDYPTRRPHVFTFYVSTANAVKAINRAMEYLPSYAEPYQVTAKQIQVLDA